MQIVKIRPYANGAHDNQTLHGSEVPDGWAIIPEDLDTPNFPFGTIEVESILGVPTVTSWTAGTMPSPTPIPDPGPSQMDRIEAQLTYTAMMTDTLIEEE